MSLYSARHTLSRNICPPISCRVACGCLGRMPCCLVVTIVHGRIRSSSRRRILHSSRPPPPISPSTAIASIFLPKPAPPPPLFSLLSLLGLLLQLQGFLLPPLLPISVTSPTETDITNNVVLVVTKNSTVIGFVALVRLLPALIPKLLCSWRCELTRIAGIMDLSNGRDAIAISRG